MFERYQVEQDSNGCTVVLYLQNRSEEFAAEPGQDRQDADKQERLEVHVRRFVQEKFPDLKVTTAKVMMGTMLLSTIPIAASSSTSAASIQITFTDILGSYAQREIVELYRAQVILGFSDGTFRPTGTMTREEFAVVLANALKLPVDPNGSSSFRDVSAWAQPYVGALEKAGLVSGQDGGDFGASTQITREEMVVFSIRALGLEQEARQYSPSPEFADAADISTWARPYVAFAQSIDLIEGIPSDDNDVNFKPKDEAERQQVALLAHKLYFERESYTETGREEAE